MAIEKFGGTTTALVDKKSLDTHVPVVQLETGSPVVTSADREVVETIYFCRTAFTGASVGDRIIKTRSLDVTLASPSTIWTQWHNDTTGLDLASAPLLANLSVKPLLRTLTTVVNVGGATYNTTSGCTSVTVMPQAATISYTVAGITIPGARVFSQDAAGSLLAPIVISNVLGSFVTVIEVRP
jgi:hypothetical protein